MLDDILSVVAELDLDEWGAVLLESVEWQDQGLALGVSVTYQEELRGRWRISCRDVRNMSIRHERCSHRLQLLTEHVLLWPHTRPHVQLYYSGRAISPAAAMGEIWEVHRRMVGNWFALDYFLNRLPPSMKCLDGGSGLFAEGPVDLIHAYAGVLRQHGFVVSMLPSVRPVWWNGAAWIPETGPMYVLLVGDSFVVAPQFDAVELPRRTGDEPQGGRGEQGTRVPSEES